MPPPIAKISIKPSHGAKTPALPPTARGGGGGGGAAACTILSIPSPERVQVVVVELASATDKLPSVSHVVNV